jgi:hypothetical protein
VRIEERFNTRKAAIVPCNAALVQPIYADQCVSVEFIPEAGDDYRVLKATFTRQEAFDLAMNLLSGVQALDQQRARSEKALQGAKTARERVVIWSAIEHAFKVHAYQLEAAFGGHSARFEDLQLGLSGQFPGLPNGLKIIFVHTDDVEHARHVAERVREKYRLPPRVFSMSEALRHVGAAVSDNRSE